MKRFMNKKVAVIGIAAALTLGIAGGAFAYFTSGSNTATGTGSTGSATNWVVTATAFSPVGALYPGAGSETGTATATNASAGNEYLTTITATIAAPTNTGSASGPACTSTDYALVASTGWVIANNAASATYAVGVDEAGTSTTAGHATTSPLTLTMVDRQDTLPGDNSGNQDNCQGATPNVTYTAS